MGSPLQELKANKERYEILIKKLEAIVNNTDDLDLESIEYLEGELSHLEKIADQIKGGTQNIAKKIHTFLAKKDPKVAMAIKDKESVEFNEILLHQGKPAKAIFRLESKAKKGDVPSQLFIGKTYLHGIIGEHGEIKMKDVALGLKWLNLAFENGEKEAGYLIAVFEKSILNIDRAVQMFESLSQDDHLKSLNELAIIYKDDPKHQNLEKLLDVKQKLSTLE